MTLEMIRDAVRAVAQRYPVSRVTLFGSRADNSCRPDSDVDLIAEFSAPVSLLTLSAMRLDLEDILGLPVDLIHGPLRPDDLILPKATVDVYAA